MSLKKSRKCLIEAFLVTLCFSCANDTKKITKNGMVNDDEEIRNISANVCVYMEENNNPPIITANYKMYVEKTDDCQLIRLDFAGNEETDPISVLNNGDECVIINSSTEQVLSRNLTKQDVTSEKTKLLKLVENLNFGKINKSSYRAVISDYEATDNKSEKETTVELPSDFFKNEREKRLSTKVIYDSDTGLLKKTEIIVELENGFICTTTSCPEYKLFDNGNYIKTGIKTIIDYKNKSNKNEHYETIVREIYSDIKVNKGSGMEFQAIK